MSDEMKSKNKTKLPKLHAGTGQDTRSCSSSNWNATFRNVDKRNSVKGYVSLLCNFLTCY